MRIFQMALFIISATVLFYGLYLVDVRANATRDAALKCVAILEARP